MSHQSHVCVSPRKVCRILSCSNTLAGGGPLFDTTASLAIKQTLVLNAKLVRGSNSHSSPRP